MGMAALWTTHLQLNAKGMNRAGHANLLFVRAHIKVCSNADGSNGIALAEQPSSVTCNQKDAFMWLERGIGGARPSKEEGETGANLIQWMRLDQFREQTFM